MTSGGRLHFTAHAALLALLALVLLSRTLVPAGYMIAPSGGWPALTLCEAAASPAEAGHEGHHQPAQSEQPCAYAALSPPALPPAPPAFAAPPGPPGPVLSAWTARASNPAEPAALPPPSTGPPARV